MNANAARRITAARTALVLDHPFFGALVLRLLTLQDPTCKTAWTDGVKLGYNPAFVETLTHDQLVGLLCHEVMHCAAAHMWRRDGREMRKWNVACDYAINPIVRDAKMTLPQGALLDPAYDGKSAEWIYARLPDMPEDTDSGSDGSPGTGGEDVRDAPSVTDDQQATESDWQQAVQQAANAAKQRGELPASLARYAKDATKPRADWRSALHRFVQQRAQDDYTWRQPSTRYLSRGLYLPKLQSERCGPIAVAIDTSGSIDDVTLSQFAVEIRAIVDDVRPSQVSILWADAQVQRIDVFGPDDPLTFDAIGGGGTDFCPVFDAVREMDDQPVCVIYLTDLLGTFPVAAVDVPTLWAVVGTCKTTVPFGERIDLE